MRKILVSGSRGINNLTPIFLELLNKFIEQGVEFILPDDPGVAAQVQAYLASIDYRRVTIYVPLQLTPRNNVGQFEFKGAGRWYTDRDKAMCEMCDQGLFLWDGSSKGTYYNMYRLKKSGKPFYVNLYLEEEGLEACLEA